MKRARSRAGELSSTPLSPTELELGDAWWRAAHDLSVEQIHLLDEPLLAERSKLRIDHRRSIREHGRA